MLKNSVKKILFIAAVVLFFYIYFKNSKEIVQSVQNSLFLCYNIIIPSLFIFIVFSFYISSAKMLPIIALPFMPLFRLLKIRNNNIGAYVVLSYIGGFSVGGYLLSYIKDLFAPHENALGILSILMCNNSPAFIIMAVGLGFLNNSKLGIILFSALTISSFMTAFVFSFIFRYPSLTVGINKIPKTNSIVASINKGVIAILNICGTVIIASVACKVISLYADNVQLLMAVTGLTEVTAACVSGLALFGKNIYLFCVLLALTPLSTALQIKYFFNGVLSLKILFLSKLLHVPLSLIIVRILVNLFPSAASVYLPTGQGVHLFWNSPPISVSFFIFCLIFIIFFDKSINIFTEKKKF